jgi:valyl-tRNA synthetase
MIAPYPEADTAAIDPQSERVMETIIEIIRAIRNVRAQYKVATGRWVEAQIYAGRLTSALAPYVETIQVLARARPVTFLSERQKGAADENKLVQVLKDAEVIIPMESMFDLETEKQRLQKEIEQVESEITRLNARLDDQAFLEKAPAVVVDKERQKLLAATDKRARLKHQLPST